MPITLGCPSCGKRFRARDESAGKRVKCPFCQSAVSVPSQEDAQNASAPTDVSAPLGSAPHPSKSPPASTKEPSFFDISNKPRPVPNVGGNSVPVATSDDWGAANPAGSAHVMKDEPSPALAFQSTSNPARFDRAAKSPGTKMSTRMPISNEPKPKLGAWKKTRKGLGWVRFALFLFTLMAFVPLGKKIYERSVGEIPKGTGWLVIEEQVNSGAGTFQTDKREEIDALAYGVPFILGGLSLILGRVTCGAVRRDSGAKGLFVISGLATLIAFAGIVTIPVCERTGFKDLYKYCWLGLVIFGVAAEFWFFLALAGCAGILQSAKAIRSIGFCTIVLFAALLMEKEGWNAYLNQSININGTEYRRPINPNADWLLYEDIAKLVGWLFVILCYWRAVGNVKYAIREYVEKTES